MFQYKLAFLPRMVLAFLFVLTFSIWGVKSQEEDAFYSLTRFGRVYDLKRRAANCNGSLPNEKVLVANGSTDAPTWLPNVLPPSIMTRSSHSYCFSLVQNWARALVNVTGDGGSKNGSRDTILLNRSQFCNITYDNYTNKCLFSQNTTADQMNDGLLWLNDTCTGSCAFTGMASDWKKRLTVTEIRGGKVGTAKQEWFWPDCLTKADLNPLYVLANKCTRHWARCDNSTLGCYTSIGIDMDCFCTTINSTILSNLGPKEQYLAFNWINGRCPQTVGTTTIHNWFPYNADGQNIFPPIVQVQPGNRSTDYCSNETYVSSAEDLHCPSKSAKLWLLGVNNLLMIPLALIFGRRTLLKKISFDKLGRRGSRMWMLTTPIMIAVEVASTAINAVLVRDTPGFSDVQIGPLILLWLSRPRMSWVVVLALPFEADKGMYFSAAASTLATEAILLIAGAYYIGLSADFGRKIGIYDHHKSSNRDVQLMYGGALIWIIFLFVAIGTIIFSVLGVDEWISSISWLGQQRVVRKHRSKCAQRQHRAVSMLATVAGDYGESSHFNTIQEIVTGWENMQKSWSELGQFVGAEATTVRRLSRQNESLKRRLERSRRDNTAAVALADTTARRYGEHNRAWNAKPTNKVSRLTTDFEQLSVSKTTAKRLLRDAEASLDDAQTQLHDVQGNLAQLDHKIEWLVDFLTSTGQLTHHQQMLDSLSFSQQLSEIGTRRRQIRSKILDDAHRTTFRQPLTSQEAIDDLTTALREVGAEVGGGGLAGRWRRQEANVTQVKHAITLRKYEYGELKLRKKELDSLRAEWERLESRIANPDAVQSEKLRKIVWISVCGLLGCWVAQWIWWTGFIGVSGDLYCPPKWGRITSIWTVFSTLNALIGASI